MRAIYVSKKIVAETKQTCSFGRYSMYLNQSDLVTLDLVEIDDREVRLGVIVTVAASTLQSASSSVLSSAFECPIFFKLFVTIV